MKDLREEYVEYCRARGLSDRTLENTQYRLDAWMRWCAREQYEELCVQSIEGYIQYLYQYRTRLGNPLSRVTIRRTLSVVRGYLHFIHGAGETLSDYARLIELPCRVRNLPRVVPREEEVRLMCERASGLSRALLELLYGSGLRNREVCNLKMYDLDLARRQVRVRNPKNREDRVVPLSRAAVRALGGYLKNRPRARGLEDVVFINRNRKPILPWVVAGIIRRVRGDTRATAHSLRHACAVGMLRNGADIRSIGRLLGHKSLSSTQVYTRLTIEDLKTMHARYHPRARHKTIERP